MSTIKVTRESGFADRVRDYKVVCDSEVIGKVSNGKTEVFNVPEGKHEIYLKIDWCRSNKIEIETVNEQQVSVSGGSSLKGIKILLACFYVIFLPHKYLWIRQESN